VTGRMGVGGGGPEDVHKRGTGNFEKHWLRGREEEGPITPGTHHTRLRWHREEQQNGGERCHPKRDGERDGERERVSSERTLYPFKDLFGKRPRRTGRGGPGIKTSK